jgi:hypothetical protein
VFDPSRTASREILIVAPKGAGSSPVGHPLTQVGTHRKSVFFGPLYGLQG